MKMLITDSGEIRELSISDPASGADWTYECLEESGAIGNYVHFVPAQGVYRISAAHYEWWSAYLKQEQEDQNELFALRSEYDSADFSRILCEEWDGFGSNYDEHHEINRRVIERVRSEARRIS